MARYTLKVFCGTKQLERFEHRAVGKLYSILTHPRNNRAGQIGPFGEILEHADKFEIYDSQMERIFQGGITDVLNFVSTLK